MTRTDGERVMAILNYIWHSGEFMQDGILVTDMATAHERIAAIVCAGTVERALADEILAELARARTKFPGDKNVTTLALVEEVGELAKATFEEGRERVRKEAIQVATMAMRVVLDGDSTLDNWRATRGLDALGGPTTPAPTSEQEEG